MEVMEMFLRHLLLATRDRKVASDAWLHLPEIGCLIPLGGER